MIVLDHETLEALRDEPELLAVADALAATARPRRRRTLAPLAAVAAAAAVAAVVLLGGRGSPDLADRALAAMGNGPVLHVVVREPGPAEPGGGLVEIKTGRPIEPRPSVLETEMWIDRARGLAHTVMRQDGRVTEDYVHTPDGEFDQDGILWTCASIARHPVEATRAGVSCNLNGDNGTTPRDVPEAPPRVDPALAAFVSGYRDALDRGTATKLGEGDVDGRAVYWLRLGDERVAIDRATYEPVRVESEAHRYDVVRIETIPEDAADFSKPPLRPAGERVVSGDVTAREGIALADAPPGSLWAGREVAGMQLAAVQRLQVRTGYARDTGLEPRTAEALALIYGDVRRGRGAGRFVEIDEAAKPLYAFGWDPVHMPVPPQGYVRLGAWFAYLRQGDTYVVIRGTAGEAELLAAARQLAAIPAAAR